MFMNVMIVTGNEHFIPGLENSTIGDLEAATDSVNDEYGIYGKGPIYLTMTPRDGVDPENDYNPTLYASYLNLKKFFESGMSIDYLSNYNNNIGGGWMGWGSSVYLRICTSQLLDSYGQRPTMSGGILTYNEGTPEEDTIDFRSRGQGGPSNFVYVLDMIFKMYIRDEYWLDD